MTDSELKNSCDFDLSTGKKVSDTFAEQITLISTNPEKFRSLSWFIEEAITRAKDSAS